MPVDHLACSAKEKLYIQIYNRCFKIDVCLFYKHNFNKVEKKISWVFFYKLVARFQNSFLEEYF